MQASSENERADESLSQKIHSLITNVEVQQKVLEKLSSQSISEAYLKLEIANSKQSELTIQELDLLKVFECFGQVFSINFTGKTAVIHYKTLVSAYFAVTILDGKKLPDLQVTLQLSWHRAPSQRAVLQEKSLNTNTENLKYTCRFDIQIPNEKHFQVSRRLIGPKGCNMKRIIQKCSAGMTGKAHDIIKLRLRGIGSGFKEGPNNTESTDPLHLCVSSKFHSIFLQAVQETEALLKTVYKDYTEFCVSRLLTVPKLEVSKSQKIGGKSLESQKRLKEIEENQELTEKEIEELVNIRNEARRQCSFGEADQIREVLRKKGVTLIDQKGRKGRGVEVTTWKYGNITRII